MIAGDAFGAFVLLLLCVAVMYAYDLLEKIEERRHYRRQQVRGMVRFVQDLEDEVERRAYIARIPH